MKLLLITWIFVWIYSLMFKDVSYHDPDRDNWRDFVESKPPEDQL